jgi:hypothetical protein
MVKLKIAFSLFALITCLFFIGCQNPLSEVTKEGQEQNIASLPETKGAYDPYPVTVYPSGMSIGFGLAIDTNIANACFVDGKTVGVTAFPLIPVFLMVYVANFTIDISSNVYHSYNHVLHVVGTFSQSISPTSWATMTLQYTDGSSKSVGSLSKGTQESWDIPVDQSKVLKSINFNGSDTRGFKVRVDACYLTCMKAP